MSVPDLVIAEGYTVDPDGLAAHRVALATAASLGCTYMEAARLSEPMLPPHGYRFDDAQLSTHHSALRLAAGGRVDFVAAVRLLEARPNESATVADGGHLTAGAVVTVQLLAPGSVVNGKLSGRAYSGGVINFGGELFVIDTATLRLPLEGRIPLLIDHVNNRIAGHAIAEILGGAVWIRQGRFSDATADGREAAGLYQEGQPMKLSVGVSGPIERFKNGTPMLINGRQQTVTAVMRNARLLEVSIVTAGADPDAALD